MNACEHATAFVVDDDQAVRDSLRWLIESVGLNVETYASAQEFLDHANGACHGCILLDVRMPEMSGLELQEALRSRNIHNPVIIITGHADVPMAVRAMKAGAMDFIEKPFNDQVLLDRIQRALNLDSKNREREQLRNEACERMAKLTQREREVMEHVVSGESSKRIASDLGLSTKTIEAHRAKIMEKMQANSVADLVRIVLLCDPEVAEH